MNNKWWLTLEPRSSCWTVGCLTNTRRLLNAYTTNWFCKLFGINQDVAACGVFGSVPSLSNLLSRIQLLEITTKYVLEVGSISALCFSAHPSTNNWSSAIFCVLSLGLREELSYIRKRHSCRLPTRLQTSRSFETQLTNPPIEHLTTRPTNVKLTN